MTRKVAWLWRESPHELLVASAELLAHRYAAREPLARGVVSFVDYLIVVRPWVRLRAEAAADASAATSLALRADGGDDPSALLGVAVASDVAAPFPPGGEAGARALGRVPYFARPWAEFVGRARAAAAAAAPRALFVDFVATAAGCERAGHATAMLAALDARGRALGFTHGAALCTSPGFAEVLAGRPGARVVAEERPFAWHPAGEPEWKLFERTLTPDYVAPTVVWDLPPAPMD